MTTREIANAVYASYVAEVASRRGEMRLDDATRAHILAAAEWLADANGKMGLMLAGNCGNGKTTLMLAICNLINWMYDSARASKRRSIRMVKAKEIARMALDKNNRDEYQRLMREDMLAIDEVGEEPSEMIQYGMPFSPIRDLLEERYAAQKLTIITTNLINTPARPQLTKHYGERVVDRLREMMTIIPFHNPSFRTPQAN